MSEYRLYCLDGDGHIKQAHDIEATDDQAAVKIARDREHDDYDCELWQGGAYGREAPIPSEGRVRIVLY
jgi:hypothetical protein